MDQRVSGMRMWLWGVLSLMGLGLIVLFATLQGEGFSFVQFTPRHLIIFAFIMLIAIGAYFLVRGRREEKTDLPNN